MTTSVDDIPAVSGRQHQERNFQLIVHKKGRERTLKSKYILATNCLVGGFRRAIRGGDWFQVFTVRAPIREVAHGEREGGTWAISATPSFREQIEAEGLIQWPANNGRKA